MGRSSTSSAKAKIVRGPGGSTFENCPYCKKAIHAALLTLHKNECTKKDADTISNQQEPVSSNDTILHGKRKRKENIDEEDEEINPVESDVFSNSTNREKELELPQKSYFETNPIMSQLKDEGWRKALEPEIKKKYFQDILKFLENEKHNGNKFFPPEEEIFNALNLTPFDQASN